MVMTFDTLQVPTESRRAYWEHSAAVSGLPPLRGRHDQDGRFAARLTTGTLGAITIAEASIPAGVCWRTPAMGRQFHASTIRVGSVTRSTSAPLWKSLAEPECTLIVGRRSSPSRTTLDHGRSASLSLRARTVSPEFRKQITSAIPLGRLGASEEIASAALFFASADASFVTGANLVVDGGFSHI